MLVLASAFLGVAANAADLTAPAVRITAPTAGSTVKGIVSVTVDATDASGIARVDLYLNRNTKLAGDGIAPYAFSWDSTKVPDGSATLTAVAYDKIGNMSSALTNVTVANGTAATATSPATTTQRTLSVSSSNAASGAAVTVYPADLAGLASGTSSFTRNYKTNTRVWLSAALRSGNNYFVTWQKDGIDYDNASTTSVVVDANHTLTAVYETPTCAGVSVYPGTDSLKNAIAAYPAGTTFCLQAGVHRMNATVTARNNDKFIGAPGAILNGSKVLSSFSRAGSYWVASGQTQQEPVFSSSLCVATAPTCIYPEKVFYDGVELWQAASLSGLGSGQFYFDYASDQIYLFDTPIGHTIEATTGSGGIVGFSGSGEYVTVKNLVFEKFGGGAVAGSSHNALKAVNGWQVLNNEFRFISAIAVANYGDGVVRNNYIHHNGQYGVLGGGTFEGNVIAANNTDGFNPNLDAGGSKFLKTIGLVVRGNIASANTGRGFWTDYDNINTTYENNIVENNTEMGIFHEVSCASVIRNNVVRGNNASMAGKSLWNGAQIYMRTSKDVQVYGNDVTAAGPGTHGISLRTGDAPYATVNCGTVQAQNVSIHDNVVRLDTTTPDLHGVVGATAGFGAANNISFQNNTYYLTDLAGQFFLFDGVLGTKEQWQAAGQDVTGKFYQY